MRRCREYLSAQHHVSVPDEMVFSDRAESGASLVRSGGIERLIAAVRSGRVHCLVVEDISRISRDLAEGAALFNELAFLGVRVIGIADGIDTDSRGSDLHVGMKLLFNSTFLRDLSDKTRRGLIGRAHAGLSTGLLPFGYRSEASPQGHRVLIDDDRAAIVRRIFTEFAAGRCLASIAAVLNADEIRPPRGNGRRGRPGWVATGVRVILLNEKYIGRWAFNALQYVKRPGTKQRISRPKPASEVVVHEYPERRIISDELWSARSSASPRTASATA